MTPAALPGSLLLSLDTGSLATTAAWTPRCRLRTEAVTTTALPPPTRADTNAGLCTVADVRLASRQNRGLKCRSLA